LRLKPRCQYFRNQNEHYTINIAQLKENAHGIWEADIIKAVALQSGAVTTVRRASDLSPWRHSDRTCAFSMVPPTFNTSHLLGFYSVISRSCSQILALYKDYSCFLLEEIVSLAAINIKLAMSKKSATMTGISLSVRHIFADVPIKQQLTFIGGSGLPTQEHDEFFPGSGKTAMLFL